MNDSLGPRHNAMNSQLDNFASSSAPLLPLDYMNRIRRGVTLIELLVAIGVIALLVAIALPALGRFREAPGLSVALGHARGLGVSMTLYHDRYNAYPFAPAGTPLVLSPDGKPGVLDVGFSPIWQLRLVWPALMHEVAPWKEHYATWNSPGLQVNKAAPWLRDASQAASTLTTSIMPSFRYSNSFLATPGTWAPAGPGPGSGEAGLVAQRADAVRFPSSKVLMFDADMAYLSRSATPRDPRAVLMADGSAAGLSNADALPPHHQSTTHELKRSRRAAADLP